MATYANSIRYEREAPKNTIRLVKSGKFLRAYGHSAWLFHTVINDYKVLRVYVKELKEEVLCLGFPEENLIDLLEGRTYVKNDLGFDVQLRDEEIPDESTYEGWCQTVATVEGRNADYNSLPSTPAEVEHMVVRRLRDFPLSERTPMECANFISELKRLLIPPTNNNNNNKPASPQDAPKK